MLVVLVSLPIGGEVISRLIVFDFVYYLLNFVSLPIGGEVISRRFLKCLDYPLYCVSLPIGGEVISRRCDAHGTDKHF